MKFPVLATIVLTACSFGATAADDPTACNQLAREIALRAAEQMEAGFDAAARSELAGIAEAVCLEFTVPAATGAVDAGLAADADAAKAPEEAPESEGRSLFNLEIIPPEERVRRPGLKRP